MGSLLNKLDLFRCVSAYMAYGVSLVAACRVIGFGRTVLWCGVLRG